MKKLYLIIRSFVEHHLLHFLVFIALFYPHKPQNLVVYDDTAKQHEALAEWDIMFQQKTTNILDIIHKKQ